MGLHTMKLSEGVAVILIISLAFVIVCAVTHFFMRSAFRGSLGARLGSAQL
jgi:hypothetical protein